jgi:hypothetical protein
MRLYLYLVSYFGPIKINKKYEREKTKTDVAYCNKLIKHNKDKK